MLTFLYIRDVPNLVERVNEILPKDIRVFGYQRVSNGFRAKNRCDARHYEYTMPTYIFLPSPRYRERAKAEGTELPDDMTFDEVLREKVNACLRRFLGSHNYHNFTSGTKFNDDRAVRVIRSFEVCVFKYAHSMI